MLNTLVSIFVDYLLKVVNRLHMAISSEVRDEANFRLITNPDRNASLKLLLATKTVMVRKLSTNA